jgi:hypothetical protein
VLMGVQQYCYAHLYCTSNLKFNSLVQTNVSNNHAAFCYYRCK